MDVDSKRRLIVIIIFAFLFLVVLLALGVAINQKQELKESLATATKELTDNTTAITGLRSSSEVLNNIIKASNQELAATKKQVDSVNNLLRLEKAGRRVDQNAFEARLDAQKAASDLVLQNTKLFLEKDAQEKLRQREDYWSMQYADVNLERIIFADSLTDMSGWCQYYQYLDRRTWLAKVTGSGKIPPPEGHPPEFDKKK